MPRGCLQFLIVVFPDHTHLLFLIMTSLCVQHYRENRNNMLPGLPTFVMSVSNNDWAIPCAFLERSLCVSLLRTVFKLSRICYKFVWQPGGINQ